MHSSSVQWAPTLRSMTTRSAPDPHLCFTSLQPRSCQPIPVVRTQLLLWPGWVFWSSSQTQYRRARLHPFACNNLLGILQPMQPELSRLWHCSNKLNPSSLCEATLICPASPPARGTSPVSVPLSRWPHRAAGCSKPKSSLPAHQAVREASPCPS